MNEPFKITYLQGRSRALGPFRDSGEGTEKEWCASLCSNLRKSNPLSGTRHYAVSCRATCGGVKFFKMNTDGEKVLDVDAPSVRGPPFLRPVEHGLFG